MREVYRGGGGCRGCGTVCGGGPEVMVKVVGAGGKANGGCQFCPFSPFPFMF